MFSDPKSSDTTFVFLNGDYKNAFSFILLLKKVRWERFEVYVLDLVNAIPQKLKILSNFVQKRLNY